MNDFALTSHYSLSLQISLIKKIKKKRKESRSNNKYTVLKTWKYFKLEAFGTIHYIASETFLSMSELACIANRKFYSETCTESFQNMST